MNSVRFVVLAMALAIFGGWSAQAADRGGRMSSAPYTTSTTTRYTTEQTYPWGLGVSSAAGITQTTSAATLWLGLDDTKAVQVYFGIESTSPFNFGMGAVFKKVVAGNMSGGLHLGGGMGFGSTGIEKDFFVRLAGVAGLHFEIPSLRNIFISADVGPSLILVKDHNNLTVGALGSLLGLSLIYMF